MLNHIPSGGLVYVPLPDPERLSEQAMALHHILVMLIEDRLRRAPTLRGCELKGDTMTILNDCAERCRVLACDIERLARVGSRQ
jgi:hypothetical protein